MVLDDVINFILSTQEVSDLPTIMDALTERFAQEMWLVSDQMSDEMPEDMAAEVEELPEEWSDENALPPLSL